MVITCSGKIMLNMVITCSEKIMLEKLLVFEKELGDINFDRLEKRLT